MSRSRLQQHLSMVWIPTGDQGEIDEDGFLKITGRVKEIFKTTKGKYVAPLPIESMLSSIVNLEQICLVGNGLPQTVPLVQLSSKGKEVDQENCKASCNDKPLRLTPILTAMKKLPV